jgi:hypothetical protein
LFALYRSAPPILQKIIVENGEKTLVAFKEWTEKTQSQWDDRVADVAIKVFEAVLGKIADGDDVLESADPATDDETA